MKLEDIGFYTLSDHRARQASVSSPLWRCELLVTSRCNLNCVYCRGAKTQDKDDISWKDARIIVNLWCDCGLRNIRFSGGEPTLWKYLPDLVSYTKAGGVDRVAVSTNGTADFDLYHELILRGVDDFSVSLDSCCASINDKIAGKEHTWDKVVGNIKKLSKYTYVTVGIVVTDENIDGLTETITFASSLGVSDIRPITAAQKSKYLPPINKSTQKHPILSYRLANFYNKRPIRGISPEDNHQCPLVLDDMAIFKNKHYPCIIYLREQGVPIGEIGVNMREQRFEWFLTHDCYKDDICKNNCLDVCVDYNNQWLKFHP